MIPTLATFRILLLYFDNLPILIPVLLMFVVTETILDICILFDNHNYIQIIKCINYVFLV